MPRRLKYQVGSNLFTVAWDKTQEYLDSCNRKIPSGGRDTYAASEDNEDERVSSTDITSFIFGQAEWTENNLPDIAYVLEPSEEWKAFVVGPMPEQKKDSQGRPMFEVSHEAGKDPRPLLDFAQLPDKISTAVHWFRLELWRRYDGRIGWEDILMRMEQPRPNQTALQMRTSRGRTKFGMVSWHHAPTMNKPETRRKVFEGLTTSQIMNNTTRGTTPGLVNPDLGELGGRIPVPISNSRSKQGQNRTRPARRLNAARSSTARCTPSSSLRPNQKNARSHLNHDQSKMDLDETSDSTNDETVSMVEECLRTPKRNREIPGAPKKFSASRNSARSANESFPDIPVPGHDFKNFAKSRFETRDVTRGLSAMAQEPEILETPWILQGENLSADPLNANEPLNQFDDEVIQYYDSMPIVSHTGTLVANAILNFRKELESIPNLFVGESHMNGVIDGLFETFFEKRPIHARIEQSSHSIQTSQPTGSTFHSTRDARREERRSSRSKPFHKLTRSQIDKKSSIDHVMSRRREKSSRRKLCQQLLRYPKATTQDSAGNANLKGDSEIGAAMIEDPYDDGAEDDLNYNGLKYKMKNQENDVVGDSVNEHEEDTWMSTVTNTDEVDELAANDTNVLNLAPQEPVMNALNTGTDTFIDISESAYDEAVPGPSTRHWGNDSPSGFVIDEFFDMEGYEGQS